MPGSPREERGESPETATKPGATKPNALLPFHRNGGGLGELERQLALGSEEGYVLVGLGLSCILGIGFGLALRSRDGIAVQWVGFPVDFHRSERHLDFVLLDLDDAAGYLGALGNHGLSVHLNRLGKTGGKGVTDFVLISGQRLSCGRADRCALRQGDHCGWFRCFGFGGRFCCGSGFRRYGRFCLAGLLCSVTAFVRGCLRAGCCRQSGCGCQSKPEIPMHLRVEHFTPPKGHPYGEWMRRLVGPFTYRTYRSTAKRWVSLTYSKSYRVRRVESVLISGACFVSSTGLSASVPTAEPWVGQGFELVA